ncbi:MAG: hypothetical protein IPO13_09885 [Rhodocyclaceae bacterium]|nr:hypothetical protein [Rhodocyclaceae bacterium]
MRYLLSPAPIVGSVTAQLRHALCERAEDIELLSAHFVAEYARRYRKGRMTLSTDALDYLRGYEYEGNVRELQGMIERAVVVCEAKRITAHDLLVTPGGAQKTRTEGQGMPFAEAKTLKCLEDEYIEYVYKKTRGSIKECSAILGIDRTTLWRRIKEQRMADLARTPVG